MKLNKKGTTIAELLVTFVILMTIVVAMLRIVSDIKQDTTNTTFKKEMLEFNDEIIYLIQTDLITKKAVSITCNPEKNTNCTINFDTDNPESKNLIVSISDDSTNVDYIIYDGIKYEFPNYESIGPNSNIIIGEDTNGYLNIIIPYKDLITNDEYEISIIHPTDLNN